MVGHACNPGMWRWGQRSDAQVHPPSAYLLSSEFEASLEHSSPCFKIRKLKTTLLEAISSPWPL